MAAMLMLGIVVGAAVLVVLALPVHAYGLVVTAPPPLPPPPPPPPDPYTLSATIQIQAGGDVVAFGKSGKIVVPGSRHGGQDDSRVHVFHPNGTFAFTLDKLMTSRVQGIAVGPSDVIAVVANDTVHMFHPNGTFDFQFGSRGSGPGEFRTAMDVAFGPGGIMAVSDAYNYRVQVFHPNGTYAYQVGSGWDQGRWTGTGWDRSWSITPIDVAFGPDGIMAVSTSISSIRAVYTFHANGTQHGWFRSPSEIQGVGFGPGGVIAVGSNERDGDKVYILHPNGTFATTDYYGEVQDVAFGPFGRLAVATGYGTVVFNITPLTGSIPVEWLPAPEPTPEPSPPNASMPAPAAWPVPLSLTGAAYAFEFGSLGSGVGQFMAASGIAFGPGGVMAVSDVGNHRVQVFHPNGTYAFALGVRGEGPGEFYRPENLAFGPNGLLAVSDMGNSRVQVFRIQ